MIKFLDLHKVNERFRGEMDAATKRVLDSGWYLLGDDSPWVTGQQSVSDGGVTL